MATKTAQPVAGYDDRYQRDFHPVADLPSYEVDPIVPALLLALRSRDRRYGVAIGALLVLALLIACALCGVFGGH